MPREGHDTNTLEIRRERRDFNPRAPRGARPEKNKSAHDETEISIHVPREGHDNNCTDSIADSTGFQSTCPARGTTSSTLPNSIITRFQSTCPARGTTTLEPRIAAATEISIHVPREGHDRCRVSLLCPLPNFNPRAPRGARQMPRLSS